ncbi:MAG: GGDEF domain-containing protein, partial [Alphaproteobacteria bacterium]
MLNLQSRSFNRKSFPDFLEHNKKDFGTFFSELQKNRQWEGELTHRHSNGELIKTEAYFFGLDFPKDSDSYFIGFYHKKNDLGQLQHSHTDVITDLPITAMFLEKLNHSLDLAKKRNEPLTVFYLDIHQMSEFNQTYGLTHGDLLITHFAKKLKEVLPVDSILSRVGGDSFAFLLHDIKTHRDTHDFIENVLTSVEEDTRFRTDLSMPILHIGACSYPDSTDIGEKLFSLAKNSSDLARTHNKTNIVYHKKQSLDE